MPREAHCRSSLSSPAGVRILFGLTGLLGLTLFLTVGGCAGGGGGGGDGTGAGQDGSGQVFEGTDTAVDQRYLGGGSDGTGSVAHGGPGVGTVAHP